jgi:hypothetical protein
MVLKGLGLFENRESFILLELRFSSLIYLIDVSKDYESQLLLEFQILCYFQIS